MYAIIQTGGRQYKVTEGQRICVGRIEGNETGEEEICLSHILAVGSDHGLHVGEPFVENARVMARRVKDFRDDKVIIFKKKRRHNYRRKRGHRQEMTLLSIESIQHAV